MTGSPGFEHSRRARRAIGRLQKKVDLQAGESFEAVVFGQRWLPFLQVALVFGALGDILFLLVARPYYVAATPSQLFMYRAGRFYPSVGERVFDAPLGEIRIERLRGGPLRRVVRLRRVTGDEHQLAVHRVYWRELDHLQSLIDAAATA
jgi:hypothetical protein